MALTDEEETQVRALRAAGRRARGPVTQAQAIQDTNTRRAVSNIETAFAELVRNLQK
jgi:hypothetical protein